MAKDKNKVYKYIKGKLVEEAHKKLLIEINGKVYTIDPDNPFYTIGESYGKVIGYK